MLATLRPNHISGLSTFQMINEKEIPIKIYSRQTVTSKRNQKRINTHEMLFCFESVKIDLSRIIRNWFDLCHKFGYIFSVYFSTIQSDNIYLEHKFLSLAQMLEAYHRALNPSKKIEYIDKKGNKKSRDLYFRERLEDLLNSLKHGVISVIICDVDKFLDTVRDTRNFLTHLDDTNKDNIADIQELFIIIDQLSAFVQLLMLTVLKIPDRNVLSNYKANRTRLFPKKPKN